VSQPVYARGNERGSGETAHAVSVINPTAEERVRTDRQSTDDLLMSPFPFPIPNNRKISVLSEPVSSGISVCVPCPALLEYG
jgi:hypothetical protein